MDTAVCRRTFKNGFCCIAANPYLYLFALILMLFSLLSGCASSNVSRDSASNVDMGFDNARKIGDNAMNGDFVESYQNAGQAAKGGLLGGATGGLLGSVATGVGALPGAVAGAILGATYGSYIDTEVTLADKLTNRGAIVVDLGDHILLVVQSSRLFQGMTARLKPQGRSTLNLVSEFISHHTTELVKIAAYTDDIGSKKVNLAVSRKQARTVERYLSDAGVNARVLFAEGFGATNLVMKNNGEWGHSDNYRIEITMTKMYT